MSEDATIIAQRNALAIDDLDYLENLVWIASTGYGMVGIALFNVFGFQNGALAAVNGIAGTNVPYRAEGNVANFDDIDYLPAELLYIHRTSEAAQLEWAKIDTRKATLITP